MRRIGHVQETANDIEVVVLKLSDADHDELHRGPKEFVNKHRDQIFGKTVNSVVLSPTSHPKPPSASTVPTNKTATRAATSETWMSVIIHRPACTCAGTCTLIKE